MVFQKADSISLALFGLFAALMLVLILKAFKSSGVGRNVTVGLLIYLVVFSVLVGTGLVKAHVLPLAPLLFVSVLGGAIYLGCSQTGAKISARYSLAMLIGIQGFRLPLELLLHHWAEIGTIPETMTWSGQNWDILTGIVSLAVIPVADKNKKAAWAAQILGGILLLNVLRVVVLSSPFPFSWPLENPLQLILYFPYALIGPLFVGVALFGHVVTHRAIRARR